MCNLQPPAGLGWAWFSAKGQRDLREGGGDRWFDEVLVIEVKQCDAVGRDREACDKVEHADALVPERPAEKRDALTDRQAVSAWGISTAEAPPLWRQLTVLQLWLRKARKARPAPNAFVLRKGFQRREGTYR